MVSCLDQGREINNCCLKQAGSGFEGLCGIPLPKHPFSHPPGILNSNVVFIGSHFTVISHSVWLSPNPSWKFSSSFHNQRKERCKPSSLDLFNAHLRERSQYGLQTNVFEERRMLSKTKIMVSENFNPTLGTESFFSRAVEMLRGRPQAVRMKSLWHPGQFWSELDHEIWKSFQKSYFVGFCPSRSLEVSVLLSKSQVLKQGFLCSLSVLLATPSLWVLTIRLKRTQI